MVSDSPATIGEALAGQVRELIARSGRITRRSAILVESSRHARTRTTLVPHCAWCGRVRVGGVWAPPEEVPGFLADLLRDRRTHSICPSCFEEVQRESSDARRSGTAVLVRAAEPLAVECLTRTLAAYDVVERPSLALEVALPDGGKATVSKLLSTVSECLARNRLEPVTVELADRTYVLGDSPHAHHPAA